jgi:penicillin-binding protein 1A
MLDGIRAAGKTGTTNGYRDAWFVGYTGNLVCGVWYGNDDYSPTNRMTGGALPAMTWHEIMKYAHQGLELRNIPGVPPPGPAPAPVATAAPVPGAGGATVEAAPRPAMLTKRAIDVLMRIETMMDKATRALATAQPPARGAAVNTPDTVAAAPEAAPAVVRGSN